MRLIVCENCEAEFKIKHDLHENFYMIQYCIFCGLELASELEDEVEYVEEWDE
jgi:hypothetical protein